MKKLLSVILALVLAFAVVGVAETADESLNNILAKGELILGLDDSFPPMGYNNENGEIVGYDIDLATEVCARLGVKLVCQAIDWNSKEILLNAGTIDCIWNGMSITPARQESMCMTPAYCNNKIVIMTKADSGINDVADLAGKYVAVQGGSFAEEVLTLEEYGYAEAYASIAEVKTVDEYLTAIVDLQNGMIDAILIDEVVGQYELAQIGDETLVCVGNLCDDLYGIGFRKADVALENAIWNALTDMANDGTLAAICAKWFGEDIGSAVVLGTADAQ